MVKDEGIGDGYDDTEKSNDVGIDDSRDDDVRREEETEEEEEVNDQSHHDHQK